MQVAGEHGEQQNQQRQAAVVDQGVAHLQLPGGIKGPRRQQGGEQRDRK